MWRFKNGEKEFGPYDLAGLRDAAEKGWIGVNTLIRQEPDGEWVSAPTTSLIPKSIIRRNTPGNPWSAKSLLLGVLVLFLVAFAAEATRDLTRKFLRDGHSPPTPPSVSEGRDGERIQRIGVSSSALRSVGYDPEQRVLEIEFTNGAVYQYSDVPAEVHRGLMAAESHGQYFHQHVRNKSFR